MPTVPMRGEDGEYQRMAKRAPKETIVEQVFKVFQRHIFARPQSVPLVESQLQ